MYKYEDKNIKLLLSYDFSEHYFLFYPFFFKVFIHVNHVLLKYC